MPRESRIMIEDSVQYPCPLNTDIKVIELPFGSEAKSIAFLIKSGSSAAIMVDKNIRAQGWFTESHLTAIFAHELGHYNMGENEEDAERWAIEHCEENNEEVAAELLRERGIV
jgi:hypothetical protein